MNCKVLKSWLASLLPSKTRIQTVCIAYILFLMVGLRNKKTLSEASRFSGLHESQFSRFLSKHFDFAAMENIHQFNHGKGFIIGHRWTNIGLIINNTVIPLPPIEFYTKKYCKDNNIEYVTENEAIIEYLKKLNLNEYICRHDPKKIVVMGDSAYGDKRIENIIKYKDKKWSFVMSLKKKRSVKSEHEFNFKPKFHGWCGVDIFFKNHRRLKWQTK